MTASTLKMRSEIKTSRRKIFQKKRNVFRKETRSQQPTNSQKSLVSIIHRRLAAGNRHGADFANASLRITIGDVNLDTNKPQSKSHLNEHTTRSTVSFLTPTACAATHGRFIVYMSPLCSSDTTSIATTILIRRTACTYSIQTAATAIHVSHLPFILHSFSIY